MSNLSKTVSYHRRHGEGALTLRGSVDIFEAAMLHTAVQRASSDHKAAAICVDYTGAERLDISAIQLLLALRRDVKATGRQFLIRGNASITAKTFAPLGLLLEP